MSAWSFESSPPFSHEQAAVGVAQDVRVRECGSDAGGEHDRLDDV
jgi:hypothetical protein